MYSCSWDHVDVYLSESESGSADVDVPLEQPDSGEKSAAATWDVESIDSGSDAPSATSDVAVLERQAVELCIRELSDAEVAVELKQCLALIKKVLYSFWHSCFILAWESRGAPTQVPSRKARIGFRVPSSEEVSHWFSGSAGIQGYETTN